jgi:hypothetical protein
MRGTSDYENDIWDAAAADKADDSANHYLPACRDFLKGHLQKNPFRQGQCAGIIEALNESAAFMPSGMEACTPNGDRRPSSDSGRALA